jgi:hypothetical protein
VQGNEEIRICASGDLDPRFQRNIPISLPRHDDIVSAKLFQPRFQRQRRGKGKVLLNAGSAKCARIATAMSGVDDNRLAERAGGILLGGRQGHKSQTIGLPGFDPRRWDGFSSRRFCSGQIDDIAVIANAICGRQDKATLHRPACIQINGHLGAKWGPINGPCLDETLPAPLFHGEGVDAWQVENHTPSRRIGSLKLAADRAIKVDHQPRFKGVPAESDRNELARQTAGCKKSHGAAQKTCDKNSRLSSQKGGHTQVHFGFYPTSAAFLVRTIIITIRAG